jgi:Na+/H+ antiporter NhaC
MEPVENAPRRALNAAVPLATVIVVTILEILRTGASGVEGSADFTSAAGLRTVLSNSDTAKALFHGSIAAWAAAVVLLVGQRILSIKEALVASVRGAAGVGFALAILFLAWSIGEVCADLGTAHVLIAMFKGSISPFVLPVTLFLLSCAVSFSTGSSWSTMAIVLPNTVLLAWAVGETYPAGPMQLTILSIGAVLEGSIFGDHCSPLSDTTILSSVASASDHIDHVRTQMPYAITTMLTALLVGYVPAVYGLHPGISFVLGGGVLVGVLLLLGRNPDTERAAAG